MSDFKIYHNNRCSKSRLGLKFLEEKGIQVDVVKYMDGGVTAEELTDVLTKLNMKPLELIRKGEDIFKKEFKGKELTDEQWVEAMVANPKLIERPIIVRGNKAVVARPTEKIEDLL